KIASSLVFLMLLPLVVGLVVKARLARVAERTQSPIARISTISLVVLISLMVVTNIQNIISLFGTRGILASIIFLLVGAGVGWFLGGRDAGTQSVLALGTAQRNIAAALVVSGQNFEDPKVVVMVVVVAVVGLVMLMPFARWLGSLSTKQKA